MRRVFTSGAPKPIGAYSQAVKAGDFLFISGQIPIDPEQGSVVEGEFKKQAERVFKNLEAILKAEGLSLDKIVFLTIYLTDLSDFPLVNEICEKYFRGSYPARESVEVSSLPRGVRIEISAVAYAG